MRRWVRALSDSLCGLCSETVTRGDPVVQVTIQGVKRARWRCRNCADSPVPPDLPALLERTLQPPLSMTNVGALAFDYKAAQAGEDGS